MRLNIHFSDKLVIPTFRADIYLQDGNSTIPATRGGPYKTLHNVTTKVFNVFPLTAYET
jgi:hypothetical protein